MCRAREITHGVLLNMLGAYQYIRFFCAYDVEECCIVLCMTNGWGIMKGEGLLSFLFLLQILGMGFLIIPIDKMYYLRML